MAVEDAKALSDAPECPDAHDVCPAAGELRSRDSAGSGIMSRGPYHRVEDRASKAGEEARRKRRAFLRRLRSCGCPESRRTVARVYVGRGVCGRCGLPVHRRDRP